jgi:hypothetical protein
MQVDKPAQRKEETKKPTPEKNSTLVWKKKVNETPPASDAQAKDIADTQHENENNESTVSPVHDSSKQGSSQPPQTSSISTDKPSTMMDVDQSLPHITKSQSHSPPPNPSAMRRQGGGSPSNTITETHIMQVADSSQTAASGSEEAKQNAQNYTQQAEPHMPVENPALSN